VGEENGQAVESKVFAECFRFLKALAKDNIQVQRRCVVMLLMHSHFDSSVHVAIHLFSSEE